MFVGGIGKQIWWISKHTAKANSRQISSYVVCLRLKAALLKAARSCTQVLSIKPRLVLSENETQWQLLGLVSLADNYILIIMQVGYSGCPARGIRHNPICHLSTSTYNILGGCRPLWSKCKQAACILATEGDFRTSLESSWTHKLPHRYNFSAFLPGLICCSVLFSLAPWCTRPCSHRVHTILNLGLERFVHYIIAYTRLSWALRQVWSWFAHAHSMN